jgi:hypothetical protein
MIHIFLQICSKCDIDFLNVLFGGMSQYIYIYNVHNFCMSSKLIILCN